MQNTYKGKTAGGFLKSAQVVQMRAGNFEVVVTLPNGKEAIAMMGGRKDGWGGVAEDVMVLSNADGHLVTLSTSTAAYSKLRELLNSAEKQTELSIRPSSPD